MNVVVDTNILAYYWLPGPFNPQAVTLRIATDDWLVPRLWRSEFRNVLAGFLRGGHIGVDEAKALAVAAEADLVDFERDVDSTAVIDLAAASRLSAYDCEFVALARSLGVALITDDAEILGQFPEVAVSMGAFAGSSAGFSAG